MLFQLRGKTYVVGWRYEQQDNKRRPFRTTCTIQELKPDKTRIEVAKDKAECSHKDRFVKNKGRKVSLRRAYKHMGLTEEEILQIWEVYKKTIRGEDWELQYEHQ